MSPVIRAAALLLPCSLLGMSESQAVIIYDVTDTSVVDCTDSPHGLWTNEDFGSPACPNNFFSIQAGTTLTINDDGTADLVGTAMNVGSTTPIIATINLTFGGFAETSLNYKQEGGAAYNSGTDSPDIDFYTSILSGSIIIDGTTYDGFDFVSPHAFQIGPGANAKDPSEFGASAWLISDDISSHHWDLNLSLAVPAPAPLLLLGSAMLGLVARRRVFQS